MTLADAVRSWPRTQPWEWSLDTMIAGHVPEVVFENLDGDADFPPFVRDSVVVVGAWWWDTHTTLERRTALLAAVR